MKLIPLPALTDNYIWMLHNGHQAVVIDPGVSDVVLEALDRESLQLEAILVTHHHPDHTAGVEALRAATGASVWGPAQESIPGHPQPLREADTLTVLGMPFVVIDVPGHTAGHIAYYAAGTPLGALLFCGDTLFSAGCGRLLGGTATQLHASLQRLAALPAQTQVCCTHEYTLSNIAFARAVEPDNLQLVAYQAHCQQLRANGLPTLPSTIGLELQVNPFLRTHLEGARAAALRYNAQLTEQAGVFACLRQWKNEYR